MAIRNVRADLEGLAGGWDGERVVMDHDAVTGTWTFICMHSSRLGPAAGGTRMKVYPHPREALQDGFRLASAMTLKMAVAGMPLGGGKAVLAVTALPDPETRCAIISRLADLIHSLEGQFLTGPDMNTSEEDMDLINEIAPYAFGRSPARGGVGNSGPATARGVFHGIQASYDYVMGSPDLAGQRVVVQGLGGVGAVLVDLLAKAGADLLVSDIDPQRVARAVEQWQATAVPPNDVVDVPCDIFSPCAVGGILNAHSIPRLRSRIVAGSANNQLETTEDALRIRNSGVLYAPDFVINSGGVLHLVGGELLGWDSAQVEQRLRGIGDTLRAIYRKADAENVSTAEAAENLAQRRLAEGPTG